MQNDPENECPYCGYKWRSRDTSGFRPVECPRCKRYLDTGKRDKKAWKNEREVI